MKRAGFIINSRVPEAASLKKGMPPHALVLGWDDAASPMSFMRFRWVAEALRASRSGWRYELFRPWRRYDAVVFLKSMGPHCLALAEKLRDAGTCVVFEANVDYYTRFEGVAQIDAMAPSSQQQSHAIAITRLAHGVIASSRHLAGVCGRFNRRTTWVPDNVKFALRPSGITLRPVRDGRLQVWWSGMASKLFEFLAAESPLNALADRIHLHIVTDDVEKARAGWSADVRDKLERFLARIPHTLHRFRDIPQLLGLYANGGVIVSPRHLDAPYNFSHTEWKISLGMACGLPAIASPVPSYVDVAERSSNDAVSLCHSDSDWTDAFEKFLTNPDRLRNAGLAAVEAVKQHYETGVVARQHAGWLSEICSRAES